MKRSLFLSILSALLVVPAAAFAADMTFIPLTSLPGLSDITMTSNSNLPDFFNMLYRLCIGAASILAVFQIIRAGFMSVAQEGSVIKAGKVRELITSAVLGLLLVLSPAIVFGIIDPRILNLSLNFESLKLDEASFDVGANGGLSTEQREVIADTLVDLAHTCGYTMPPEQATCWSNNVAHPELCFPPRPTDEQLHCIGVEAASLSQQCRALGEITEGRVVPEDKQQCCAMNGLQAVRGAHSSSYTCTNAQPQAEDEQGRQPDGSYFINIPTTVNQYTFILVKNERQEGDQCTVIVYGTYADNEACTAAQTSQASQHPTYVNVHPCNQNTHSPVQYSGSFPFCSPTIIQ